MDDSGKAAEIQRQMAALRVDLHHDVEGIVENAKTLTDWRYYVRKYPWLCAGGAAVLGYLLIPAKLKFPVSNAADLLALAKKHGLTIQPPGEAVKQGSMIGSLVGLLATTAARSAVSYFTQQASQRFAPPQPTAGEPVDAPRRPR